MFSYDSPVWKFMGRLVDFLVLTLLWAVTSLPVVTMGTATTVVYYITLKMTKDQEGYIIPAYFKSFARFFAQTTKVWIMVLVVGGVLCGNLYLCLSLHTPVTTMLLAAFFLLAAVFVMTAAYLFPVMAWLDGSITDYLKAAFYLALKYFGWTILIIVIAGCLVVLGIFVFWPLLLIIVGLTAYLQSLIFNQIFSRQ